MRVLHLGSGNLFGGIETLLITYASERSACPDMVPEFGVCFEGRLSAELRKTGATVYNIGKVRFSRPWSVWRARRQFRQLMAKALFDAVVTHGCWPHAIFARIVRETKIPLLFTAHDVGHPEHWLDRRAAPFPPDIIVANSRYTLSGIGKVFPNVPAEVVHYPVRSTTGDVDRRPALRRELDTPEASTAIFIAARMEAWKGHAGLLQALGALKDNPDWTCWIAGGAQRPAEQDYLQTLREQEIRLGLVGRLRWLGQRNDIPDLMSAADVYCQPNLGPEPFGIVFIESMYAARPVVSTRQGGPAEFVDDSCGILVEPGDLAALAASLGKLIESAVLRRVARITGARTSPVVMRSEKPVSEIVSGDRQL